MVEARREEEDEKEEYKRSEVRSKRIKLRRR